MEVYYRKKKYQIDENQTVTYGGKLVEPKLSLEVLKKFKHIQGVVQENITVDEFKKMNYDNFTKLVSYMDEKSKHELFLVLYSHYMYANELISEYEGGPNTNLTAREFQIVMTKVKKLEWQLYQISES